VKLTRRQLVITAAAGAAAVKASAQSASSATAADKVRQNADTLAKFTIPITTEPAFQFKA
jgi:hypothetical protein